MTRDATPTSAINSERIQDYIHTINLSRGVETDPALSEHLKRTHFSFNQEEFTQLLQTSKELHAVFYNKFIAVHLHTDGTYGHVSADLPAKTASGIQVMRNVGLEPADGGGLSSTKAKFINLPRSTDPLNIVTASIPVPQEQYENLAELTAQRMQNPGVNYQVTALGENNYNCIHYMHKHLQDAGITSGLNNIFSLKQLRRLTWAPILIPHILNYSDEFKLEQFRIDLSTSDMSWENEATAIAIRQHELTQQHELAKQKQLNRAIGEFQQAGVKATTPAAFPNFSPETSFESLSTRVNKPSSLLLQRDVTEKKLEEHFQKRMPKKEAAKNAKETLKKITDHFKQSFTKNDATVEESKKELLKELDADVEDQSTQKIMHQFIEQTGEVVNKVKPSLNDFYAQQGKFAAFERLDKIQYARAEIGGVQEIFHEVGVLGKVLDCPALTKTAQFGLGLANVALRVTDVLASTALKTLGMAGVMAATGNWVGLVGSMVGLLIPFLNSGPSEQQIMFDYMQKAFKHVDKRFDHIDKTLRDMHEENRAQFKNVNDNIKVIYEHIQVIHKELHHIMDIGNANLEMSKRLGQQIYNFQEAIQLPLDNIQGLIKGLHRLVSAGFEEIQFKEFRSTLRQIDDLLVDHTSQSSQALLPLTNTLVGDYILEMSRSRFHTGEFLFDPTLFNALTPTQENLFFSDLFPADQLFVTHPDRYEQARRITELFREARGDNRFLIGFFAAYAKALLADEQMDPQQITQVIQQIIDAKNKLQDEPRDSDKKDHHYRTSLVEMDSQLAIWTRRNVTATHSQLKQAKQKETLDQKNKNLIREKQLLLKDIETSQEKNAVLDQKMQQLMPDCDPKTQTPVFPLPSEAKEWIESHQTLEIQERQLERVKQQTENLELEKLIDAQPPFQLFNTAIFTKAMDAYLNILRQPNAALVYRNPMRHLHQIIAMEENALKTIGKLQHEPLLFQHLWRACANSLLFINYFYREKYQQFFDALPVQEKGRDDVVNAIIHPEKMRAQETKYVQQELLNRDCKTGSDFERYLLIAQSKKDVLIAFCELLGAPATLITTLNQLPDQKIIHTQLNKLLQFNEPAAFTQAEKMYLIVNNAARELSDTVFSETYEMPLPTNTTTGRIIAAYLKPLYDYRTHEQMQRLSQSFSQDYFLSTFAGVSDQDFVSNVSESITESTELPTFETQLQKARVMTSLATMPAENATNVVSTEMKKQFIQYVNDTLDQGVQVMNALQTSTQDALRLEQETQNLTATLPAQLTENYQPIISDLLWDTDREINATQTRLNVSQDMHATLRSQIENTMRLDHVNNPMIKAHLQILTDHYAEITDKMIELSARMHSLQIKKNGLETQDKKLHNPLPKTESQDVLASDESSLASCQSHESLDVIQERINEIDAKIRGQNEFLFLVRKERDDYRERITQLMSDDAMVIVGDVSFREEICFGEGKDRYCKTGIDFPEGYSQTHREHIISYQGEPFHTYKIGSNYVTDCIFTDWGKGRISIHSREPAYYYGAPAEFEILTINPKEGKFSAKYTSPNMCFGLVDVHFKIPNRETKQSKTKIQEWKKLLEQVEDRISYAFNYASGLMTTQARLQEQYMQIRLLEAQCVVDQNTVTTGAAETIKTFMGEMRKNIANHSMLILHAKKMLFAKENERDAFREKITRLTLNVTPTTVHTFRFDGSDMLAFGKEEVVAEVDENVKKLAPGEWRYSCGKYGWCKTRLGMKYKGYEYAFYYEGEPYKNIQHELLDHSRYRCGITVEKTDPSNGQYSGKCVAQYRGDQKPYKSSSWGVYYIATDITAFSPEQRILLQRPYNEREIAKTKLQFLKDAFKETVANISHTSRYIVSLEATLEKVENQFVQFLVEKTQREISVYSQIENTVRTELDEIQVASTAQKENYQNVLASFHFYRPLYEALAQFIQLANVSDASSIAFHEQYLAVGTLLHDHESHRPSYNGSWVERLQRDDVRTGAPIYRMSFIPPERPLLTNGETSSSPRGGATEFGHIDLYGSTHLCRSDTGRTNVVEATGIFENHLPDLNTINAVCTELPPTFFDIMHSGAVQGALRGAANIIGKAICSDRVSEKAKSCIQEIIYVSGYFAMRLHGHLQQEKGDTGAALWKSAVDTFLMWIISLALKIVEKMIVNNCPTSVARNACSLFSRTAPFAYAAYQQGLVGVADKAAYTAAAIATQTIVEKMGR